MVMYGIRLAIASLSGTQITERLIDSVTLLLLVYITAGFLEDKGD